LFFHIVIDVFSLLDEINELRENDVIIDDFSKLWEMPRKPFLQSHAKSVNVFVQLLNQGNGLNDWFVLPVYVGSALLAGVGMTQTKLGASDILVFDLLHDLDEMSSNSSLEFGDRFIVGSGDSGFSEDPKKKIRVRNTLN
jgi:hypothetical protein